MNPRIKFTLWIFFVKILDHFSTIRLTDLYGWGVEANPFVNLLTGFVSPEIVSITLIFAVTALNFFLFSRSPVMVETLSLVIPIVTIGNLLQLYSSLIGSIINVFAVFGSGIYFFYSLNQDGVFVDGSNDVFKEDITLLGKTLWKIEK